jgi:hypothetical protein
MIRLLGLGNGKGNGLASHDLISGTIGRWVKPLNRIPNARSNMKMMN